MIISIDNLSVVWESTLAQLLPAAASSRLKDVQLGLGLYPEDMYGQCYFHASIHYNDSLGVLSFLVESAGALDSSTAVSKLEVHMIGMLTLPQPHKLLLCPYMGNRYLLQYVHGEGGTTSMVRLGGWSYDSSLNKFLLKILGVTHINGGAGKSDSSIAVPVPEDGSNAGNSLSNMVRTVLF